MVSDNIFEGFSFNQESMWANDPSGMANLDPKGMVVGIYRAPDKRGKRYFSIDFFWNSALKIKLKGKNTLCSLSF